MRALLLAAAIFSAAPARANNIITAEHPPFGDKGWALQFDNRVIASVSDEFVSRTGTASDRKVSLAANLFITRLYIPGWLFRASLQYSDLENAGRRRGALADAVVEAGLSRESGPWRWRALLFAGVPTADYDPARLNTGAGAWSLGPNFSVTRYLADKKYDLNLWAQYSRNFTNPETRVRAGDAFAYAFEASALFDAGLPVRAGIEQRGTLSSPNEVGGSSRGQWGRSQFSAGPALMINLQKYLPGCQLWPIAQFDFYNRNTQKTDLYYLKLQYNW